MPIPDKTRALHRPSARTLVFEQLRAWIEDGTLAPGEVVKDVVIADKLGVSRTPVREALQMLEQLGVIESEPGRRTRVTTVGPDDAALVYPPLGALQALAAELAAGRLRPADLREMAAANERLREAAEAGEAVLARQADEAFHAVPVRVVANGYLASAIAPLELHSRRLNTSYFSAIDAARTSYGEHLRIIEALRRGDRAAAGRLTYDNFVHSVLEGSA